ncbi:MAG: hypothetical protein ISR65_14510 [Bacteriovoracaceae bacterium]|nr:hypothetical protein [Bacteriovoracaceae bacterium]
MLLVDTIDGRFFIYEKHQFESSLRLLNKKRKVISTQSSILAADDQESVAKEVLQHLESLNMNLVTTEDIPLMLYFLNVPNGHFAEGRARWDNDREKIDYSSRKKTLKCKALYKKFCK